MTILTYVKEEVEAPLKLCSTKTKEMTNQPKSIEFAIVGGGIAGLSAAIGLKRVGIDATVFEAAPEFRPLGAGMVLAANAMKALDYLGIHDAVCARGRLIERLQILNQKGQKLTNTRVAPQEGGYQNHTIHRGDLHQVLLRHFQGDVLYGKRLQDLSEMAEGHLLQFDDGTEYHARFIISAEGIHSKLRGYFLPESEERYAGYTCWRGVAVNARVNTRLVAETWGTNGRFGIVPLTNNRTYWFAVVKAPQNSPEMAKWTLNDVKRNYANYHHLVAEVLNATPKEGMLWNDIIDLKPISKYAFNNTLLIGDAAHATTPNMGQGACMAVEDAAVLSHLLKNGESPVEAFRSFEQRRLKRTHDIVNRSWQMGRLAQNQNPILGAIRNTVSRLVPNSVTQRQLEKVYEFEL